MNKTFIFLLIGFILLTITTYHYSSPQKLSIQQVCDTQRSVCANCPLYEQPQYQYDINAYTYIFDNNPFSTLISVDDILFKKAVCKDYLKIVNSSLSIQPNEQLNQYIKHNKIVQRSSFFLKLPTLSEHTIVLNKAHDFIIFTRLSNSKPMVYVQKPNNAETLLNYSRILGWSTLLTLIIASLSYKIGFSLFTVDQFSVPFLQITALVFSLYCSEDTLFFKQFQLIQVLYLTVIYMRTNYDVGLSKYMCILWIVSCMAYQNFIVAGQVYLAYFFIRNVKNGLQIRVSGVLIIIGIFIKLISLMIPFNVLVYFNILWKIIFFPIIFLILQTKIWSDQRER